MIRRERIIAIPLYDHTTDEEIADIMANLQCLGFSREPYLTEVSHAVVKGERGKCATQKNHHSDH